MAIIIWNLKKAQMNILCNVYKPAYNLSFLDPQIRIDNPLVNVL